MTIFNFNDFCVKNKNETEAFEDLCRNLFLRELKQFDFKYSYNANQAGLEIEPIYNSEDNKWYGFQAKFFQNNTTSSSKYNQIKASLDKAYSYYEGRLDVIYIYTNTHLQINLSEEEKNKKTNRAKIFKDAEDNSVELVWELESNILDKVKLIKNLDLYYYYFSNEKIVEFMDNRISIRDITFIDSKENIKIPMEPNLSSLIESIDDKINEKIILLLGSAGTGKTVLMKELFLRYSRKYKESMEASLSENYFIPIYIRLKEVLLGDLEDLIRQRLKDFNIDTSLNDRKLLFLFDGLDEIYIENLIGIIVYLEMLYSKDNIMIIISSRVESINLNLIRQNFKCKEFYIKNLDYNHIKEYFRLKGDKNKIEELEKIKNSTIIEEVTDVFSLGLVWSMIYNIDANSNKMELIEHLVHRRLKRYDKLNSFNILEPKRENVYNLLEEIAYIMQIKNRLYIKLYELQQVIKDILNVESVGDINQITYMLFDLFFENTNIIKENEKIFFTHKRYQEYFLYKKISKLFYKNPNILRELNLLPNKDFIINIFLKMELQKQMYNDLPRYLLLRLFECYLGDSYVGNHNNDIIGYNYYYGVNEPSYKYSDRALHLLASYEQRSLTELLNHKFLGINEVIDEKNYVRLIELHHKYTGEDLTNVLSESFKNIKNIDLSEMYSILYIYIVIKGEDLPSFIDIISKDYVSFDNIEKESLESSYKISELKMEIGFISFLLEFDIKYLEHISDISSPEFIELLFYEMLQLKNIRYLLDLDYKIFIEKLINKKNLGRFGKILYSLINENDDKYNLEMQEIFNQKNINHIYTWKEDIDINIYLSIIMETCHLYHGEYKFAKNIVKIFMDNFNSDKIKILNEWKSEIKRNNYIYKNYLIYDNSRIVGQLLAVGNFNIPDIKKFIKFISEYDTVIYLETVLFEILKLNPKMIRNITSESMLNHMVNNIYKNKKNYVSVSESLYTIGAMYAKDRVGVKNDILFKAMNNELVRPLYKGEDIFEIAVQSIVVAYENYWIDKGILEKYIKEIYEYMEELSGISDNYFDYGVIKNILVEYLPENELLNNIKEESSVITSNSTYKEIKFDRCSSIDLRKFYEGNLIDEKYLYGTNLYINWLNAIKREKELNGNLNILFEVFEKNMYPGFRVHSILEYSYIPTSILLEDKEYKDQIMKFIYKNPGRTSIYNMIKVSALIGNDKQGIEYFNYFIAFIRMVYQTESNDIDYSYVINSTNKDWIIREEINTMYFKEDSQICIKWDDLGGDRKFHEPWAIFYNEPGYMYKYIFSYNSIEKEKYLVWVDGFRVLLPIPKVHDSLLVAEEDYLFCRIINTSVDELNRYMILSEFEIE